MDSSYILTRVNTGSLRLTLFTAAAHPLVERLSFTTQDWAVLQQIAEDGCIHEVTVYSGGRAVSHLKHARLVQLAGSHAEISILRQTFKISLPRGQPDEML